MLSLGSYSCDDPARTSDISHISPCVHQQYGLSKTLGLGFFRFILLFSFRYQPLTEILRPSAAYHFQLSTTVISFSHPIPTSLLRQRGSTMAFSLSSKARLMITIAISFSFFVVEITGQ